MCVHAAGNPPGVQQEILRKLFVADLCSTLTMIQEQLEFQGPLTVVDPLLQSVLLDLKSLRGHYVLFVVFHGANHNVSSAEFAR